MFRKKYFYWLNESEKLASAGNQSAQIRQYQSLLFQISEELAKVQEYASFYKRIDRYLLLGALFIITVFTLFLYNRWHRFLLRYKSKYEEFELERFKLQSIQDDYHHEMNQI